MPLKKAFAAARDAIVTAACQKVIALDGEIDQPVPIIGSDICRRAAERSKPVRQP
jgi:hypothetical protein